MPELKPCPFCGGTPIIGSYGGEQVSCPNCHVAININLIGCQYALHKNENEYKGYEAVYQALQIWNTRHEEKALTVVWCKDCKYYHDGVCCNPDSDCRADFLPEYCSCEYCHPKGE